MAEEFEGLYLRTKSCYLILREGYGCLLGCWRLGWERCARGCSRGAIEVRAVAIGHVGLLGLVEEYLMLVLMAALH